MDMTLAEQLVWAAVYAVRWENGIEERDSNPGLHALNCARMASQAVTDLREARQIHKSWGPTVIKRADNLGIVTLEHVRQMTYKAKED